MADLKKFPCSNTGCVQYDKTQKLHCKTPMLLMQNLCNEYSPGVGFDDITDLFGQGGFGDCFGAKK